MPASDYFILPGLNSDFDFPPDVRRQIASALELKDTYAHLEDGVLVIGGTPVGGGGGGGGGNVQATEDVKGIAEIATTEEVTAGTDDARIVTPKKLKSFIKDASEAGKGIVELATTAETAAGTSAVLAVTPATVKPLLDAKVAGQNGLKGAWSGTQTELDALATRDGNTLYFVVSSPVV
jgi:hypothetical protein